MLKQYLLAFYLTFVTSFAALAQAPSGVRGVIKTKKGEPLPFAAIIVKGTSISTI
jgi:hypothetical protein